MPPEPFLVLMIVRAELGYLRPKLLRMVHLFEMKQLVDDDVFDYRLWCHHQPPIKTEVLLAGATAPPRLLPAYNDLPVADSYSGT